MPSPTIAPLSRTIILSALLVANMSACSYVSENNPGEEASAGAAESTPSNINASQENTDLKNQSSVTGGEYNTGEIITIAQGDNYHYYQIAGTFELGCDIYNSEGEIILSEKMKRPLTVSEIDDDIIEIRIGYGTGIIGRRYFNTKNDQLSEEYFYVIATRGTQIAYLEGNSLSDRKLIVKDIFAESDSYQSFSLDFSPTHTPVIDGEFSEDASSLCITYQKGESYSTAETVIVLS